jgi:hypothetical protein
MIFFTLYSRSYAFPVAMRCDACQPAQASVYDSENRSHGDRNHNAIDAWVIRIKETAVHHRPTCAESIEPGYEEQVILGIV